MANVQANTILVVPPTPNRPIADHIFLKNLAAQPAIVTNTLQIIIGQAYGQANLARDQANTATAIGEAAYGTANLAIVISTNAYAQANLAYTAANAAANTVAVYQDGTLVQADANIGFNNTATINISTAVIAGVQTVVTLIANTSAIVGPDVANIETALGTMNAATATALAVGKAAYAESNSAANTVAVYQNGVLVLAAGNVMVNNTSTINLAAVANGTFGSNISATINTNLVLTTITAQNATVNGTNFIPSWTNATLNSSYTTISGYNPPAFWVDPFGIVHIKGLVKPVGNVAFSAALNVNIANGFPTPANGSVFLGSAANATIPGTNTSSWVSWNLCTNGALQITGDYPLTTGNLVYASMDGITYGYVGG